MFSFLDNFTTRLMVDLCQENITDPELLKENLAKCNIEKLFSLCQEHELEGVVASHILQKNLMDLPSPWLEAYEAQKTYLTILRNKAKEICIEMDKNEIKMIVLKNGGIMIDMVEDAAACPMGDIDTLVKKEDFIKAHELLLKMGFKFKFRSEYEFEDLRSAFVDGSTEYYLMTPHGEKIWFELAWRAVAGRWIRQDLEPKSDELIENAYYSPNSRTGILSPEDNLLQVCVHTAKHSYVRAPGLRLHLDVERIVTHKNISWDEFVQKVEAAHLRTSVFFSLYISKELFGTPVPATVLAVLKPKEYKFRSICRQLSKAELLHPQGIKFSKFDFLRFQLSLYDGFKDLYKVINPGIVRLQELYNYQFFFLTPYYILLRGLDLLGIRKKYK